MIVILRHDESAPRKHYGHVVKMMDPASKPKASPSWGRSTKFKIVYGPRIGCKKMHLCRLGKVFPLHNQLEESC